MKKSLVTLLAISMCAVMLAGCGAPKETAAADTANDTAAAADTTQTADEDTDQAAEAGSAVLADGVLTVGTNAEFPPFEYVGDDGEPDGFDMALIKAVGDKMGVEVKIENMEFASLVSSIGNKIDVAIAGMTVTDERKEVVDFSDSYYDAVQYVIVPADSSIATADDLVGKTIGVQLGTTGDFLAQDIEGSTVSSYNKAVDAVNDLLNGRSDLVIVDKNPAEVFAGMYPDDVIALDGAQFGFEVENYAIAMPKGDAELANAINQAIKDLKADGTFDKLVAEYIEGSN
ncbi:MAG: basic amino acid ABC transporter substrate-binding protein [Lachnospiraceae bacterium]|nr:basic amino acid ABC transporter substrate-binding protein [Lachnospiraceae bacterium]